MKWTTQKPEQGGYYWRGVKAVKRGADPITDGIFRVLHSPAGSGEPLMFERQWQSIPEGFLWARVPEPKS